MPSGERGPSEPGATSAEGVIRVRVYLDAERRPAIEVEDDGIGIPADKLEAVTQAFYQVNPQVGGAGLGLHLVRRFAELHGGTVSIESVLGAGTRVRVTLPASRVVLDTGNTTDLSDGAPRRARRASGGD